MHTALTPVETYGVLIIIKWIIKVITGDDVSFPPSPFPIAQ